MDSLNRTAMIGRCRELASECLHLIPGTEEQEKPTLLELAEYWTALANKAARGEEIESEISLVPIADQLRTKPAQQRKRT